MTQALTKRSKNDTIYNCMTHNALRYVYLLDPLNAILSHPLKCEDNGPETNEYRTIGKDILANPIPSAVLVLCLAVGAIGLRKPAATKSLKVKLAADESESHAVDANLDAGGTDTTATHTVAGETSYAEAID
jgi:hypothetical protein